MTSVINESIKLLKNTKKIPAIITLDNDNITILFTESISKLQDKSIRYIALSKYWGIEYGHFNNKRNYLSKFGYRGYNISVLDYWEYEKKITHYLPRCPLCDMHIELITNKQQNEYITTIFCKKCNLSISCQPNKYKHNAIINSLKKWNNRKTKIYNNIGQPFKEFDIIEGELIWSQIWEKWIIQ